MPPETRGRAPGALEREVLACLAAAGRPLSPADVRAELGDRLAYTTVMTTLSRLHAKGAVSRQAAGRGYVYALRGGPGDAQASMTAHRMLRLLETGGDRVGVLSRFVADLSPGDEQLLMNLLASDQHDGGHQDPAPQPNAAPSGPAAPEAGQP
ncbi:MAG: BlaI/MecI/CopY family transcriptional regulator [Actinomycetota bacterium]